MNWTDFKVILVAKKLLIQYSETDTKYNISMYDDRINYKCSIIKASPAGADQTNFETYYKTSANKPMTSYSQEGKPNVIASSRPNGTNTYFTTAGDGATTIGDGKRMAWDCSNSDDQVTAPSGYKRKRLDITFIDPIWIKEGSMYFFDAVKGTYADCYVVCPTGGWYIKNDGSYAQASEDTIIFHYVNQHPIQGSTPMGDELNTEETQIDPILPGYIVRLEITIPVTDVLSNGVVEFECFRQRTVIL